MTPQVLSTIGLLLNVVGVFLLAKYGLPQPSHDEGVSIGVEDNTPLPDGQTVAEYSAGVRARRATYERRAWFAIFLIILGYGFQIWAVWR
jgi:hypothetical protein